ncbi:MAG: hypothetical protein BMS9Abin05_0295 [Rhodothermia bacterium]|nr:MAG: hypothetical protein BMS9Abin05_0295 [Rhodothermia bacterium]
MEMILGDRCTGARRIWFQKRVPKTRANEVRTVEESDYYRILYQLEEKELVFWWTDN